MKIFLLLIPCFSNLKNIDLVFPKGHFPLPWSLQPQTKSSLVVMKQEFLHIFSQVSPLVQQSLGGVFLQEKFRRSLTVT